MSSTLGTTGGTNTTTSSDSTSLKPTVASSSSLSGGEIMSTLRAGMERLMAWQNPYNSGRLIAGINMMAIIVWYLDWSWSSYLMLGCAFTIAVGYPLSRFVGWQKPARTEYVTSQQIENVGKHVHAYANQAAAVAVDLFYWTDLNRSASVVIVLFVAAFILSIFSIPVLVLLGLNALLLKKPAATGYNKYAAKHADPYVKKARAFADQVGSQMPEGLKGALGCSGSSTSQRKKKM